MGGFCATIFSEENIWLPTPKESFPKPYTLRQALLRGIALEAWFSEELLKLKLIIW